MAKELDRPRTLEEASKHFKAVLTPLIPKIVAVAKKETPDWYAKWLKATPVLGYLFAGFDTDGKSLILIGEVRIDSAGRPLPIKDSTWRGESGPADIVSFGNNEQILNYTDRHPGWRIAAASDPVAFIEKMVRIEIQASQREGRLDVGDPISIVSLTKNDGHFKTERSGNCQSREVIQ